MKKIILALIMVFLFMPSAFSEEKPDSFKLSAETVKVYDLKDPKLIQITHTEAIDKTLYNQKISNDAKKYLSYKKQFDESYYNLYRILEKLIRANNLYYQNWRLLVKTDAEEVNATSSAANLIQVYSSLYDSLCDNENALAFVLAHEIGHFVLDHHQSSVENSVKIHELEVLLANLGYGMRNQSNMASLNNALGNSYAALGNQISNTAYMSIAVAAYKDLKKLYEQERMFEYDADSEAVTMLARAGYDVNSSIEALEFMDRLPEIQTFRSTHPLTADRITNMKEVIELTDVDELQREGKRNIYNSNVLEMKKSSDKKSVVISKSSGKNKVSYTPKTKIDKMIEKAYKSYLNKDMKTAEEYFTKAFLKNPKNYIPALYLSYLYEYKFYENHDKKNLKMALRWSKASYKANPNDKNVIKQKADIIADFKKLRASKHEHL